MFIVSIYSNQHQHQYQHRSKIPHVAFIDSGIGGMSVLFEVRKTVPIMNVSYLMDNLYLPYGQLNPADLLRRLTTVVQFIRSLQPDLVVIACNTASTHSLSQLRRIFSDQQFVGVVPAIKPAAMLAANKLIGLLATPATASSDYLNRLMTEYAADCQLISLGTSALVKCAEEYFWNETLDIDSFPDLTCFEPVDVLVLGCTHFPLISHFIQQHIAARVKLLDSGVAIAKRVCNLIKPSLLRSDVTQIVYCTKAINRSNQQRLNELDFDQVQYINLDPPV